jgi:hypothetical protein
MQDRTSPRGTLGEYRKWEAGQRHLRQEGSLMKGIWILVLAAVVTTAFSAGRVVMFEQFTSIT